MEGVQIRIIVSQYTYKLGKMDVSDAVHFISGKKLLLVMMVITIK